jgi:hypothetical protein
MEDGRILALRRHHKAIFAVSTQDVGIHPLLGKLSFE